MNRRASRKETGKALRGKNPMRNKTILISMILSAALVFSSGCTGRKDSGSETGEGTTSSEVTQDAAAGTDESGEDPESDATPEYVEDYTIELKEDEVFEIH